MLIPPHCIGESAPTTPILDIIRAVQIICRFSNFCSTETTKEAYICDRFRVEIPQSLAQKIAVTSAVIKWPKIEHNNISCWTTTG